MEPKSKFEEMINELFTVNAQCVSLSNKLSSRVEFISPKEVEFTSVRSIVFEPHTSTEGDDVFVLRQQGQRQKLKLKLLKDCFGSLSSSESFKNVLRTPLPEYEYFDLKEEIQVYELLDPRKGYEILSRFLSGLKKVRESLEERLEEISTVIGVGKQAVGMIETFKGKRERYFKVKKEGFLKAFRFEFQVELLHEKALVELEEFLALIEKYFIEITHVETPNSQKREPERKEKKERKDKESRKKEGSILLLSKPFLQGSELVDQFEQKELLSKWLEEEGISNPRTELLLRASRDGFDCDSFHQRCDNQGKTLVLVRAQNGTLFGGFANASWHSKDRAIPDEEKKSFLFSFDHKTKYRLKQSSKAMFGESIKSDWILSFGDNGSGLILHKDGNENCSSYTYPSYTFASYNVPSELYLASSRNFQLKDYEVWRIN